MGQDLAAFERGVLAPQPHIASSCSLLLGLLAGEMGERGGVEQLNAEDSGETSAQLHVRSDLLQPDGGGSAGICLLYTSPSPRDKRQSRMPSSA